MAATRTGATSASSVSAAEPLRLQKGPQLFLDEYMIARAEDLKKVFHSPRRLPRPVLDFPTFETTHYYNHVFVYDTQTNLFGTATALPFDDVASITVVDRDTVYIFPGETGGFEWEGEYFGHHPEFMLKGAIKERDWNR